MVSLIKNGSQTLVKMDLTCTQCEFEWPFSFPPLALGVDGEQPSGSPRLCIEFSSDPSSTERRNE